MSEPIRVGGGPGCMYCGERYGEHRPACPFAVAKPAPLPLTEGRVREIIREELAAISNWDIVRGQLEADPVLCALPNTVTEGFSHPEHCIFIACDSALCKEKRECLHPQPVESK